MVLEEVDVLSKRNSESGDQQTSRNKAPLVWRMGSKLLQPQAVQAVATASCCNMDRWENNSDLLCRHLCTGQQTFGNSLNEIREWGANCWALIRWEKNFQSSLQQQQTSSIRSITRRRPTAQIGRRRRSDGSIEKIGRKKDRPIGSEIETQGIDCKRPDSTTSSWLSLVCLWWSRAIQLASKTSSEIALY